MKIVLPWPDSKLTPNAKRRLHWRVYQPTIKKARVDAAFATMAAVNGGMREVRAGLAGSDKIALTVTFYPPDRRHRDDDGMVGSFKHYRDGIADALGVDDRRFRPHYFFRDAEKPGRIEVEFLSELSTTPIPSDADSCPVNGLPPDETEAA